jgi:DNA-binding winged helix-turn-helix (wHTH) protein/tetratricopeptide (TPR) repeat protein
LSLWFSYKKIKFTHLLAMTTSLKIHRIFAFGPFRFDPLERTLLREGVPVPLAPKLFDTLLALVENSGHLIEKDELISRLWSDTFVEETSLTQNIFQLRKILKNGGSEAEYIETIPKRGYRFAAEVKILENGYGAKPTNGHHVQNGNGSRPSVRALAVLPFRLMGTDAEPGNYLGLGIADAIITKLSSLRQLDVIPTRSVFKFAERDDNAVDIGHNLGVEAILQGTIQQSSDRIRLTIQLISVSEGKTLWADKFDENFTDIFAIEDSISEKVAASLALHITADGVRQLRKRYTQNTEAYQAYLMGLFFWNKRTNEALSKAAIYFREAIVKDPAYALAYAGLADTYFLIAYRDFNEMSREKGFETSRATAMSALELDPFVAEAHAAIGTVQIKFDKDPIAAEASFKRAIEVNPSCVMAYSRYTWFLAAMGRLDESLQMMKRAQELDPLSPEANTDLANILYFAGDYDAAIQYCERALALEPNFLHAHVWLGLCYQEKGQTADAIAQFRKADVVNLDDTEPLELLGYAYATSGHKEKAQKVLGQLEGWKDSQGIRPYNIGLIHAALGKIDKAFSCLDKPYVNWTERLRMLRYDPRMNDLRRDPRFPQFH